MRGSECVREVEGATSGRFTRCWLGSIAILGRDPLLGNSPFRV